MKSIVASWFRDAPALTGDQGRSGTDGASPRMNALLRAIAGVEKYEIAAFAGS